MPLVIDDQTSPSQIATAVQEADSKAFGIVSQSPLFFLAAKYPNEAGVPVTGTYDDGPEWGTQPYTNMFASDEGSVDPKYPVNTQIGDFLKQHGGTDLGSYGYGISPSSAGRPSDGANRSSTPGARSASSTRPSPSAAWTSPVAAPSAKQDGVNAMVPAMDANSNYALARRSSKPGSSSRPTLFATGYEPDVIKSPAWTTSRATILVAFRPFSLPNAGTEQMQAAMEKYAHFTKTQFPTFGQYEAWAGADLMIKGLEMARENPTRAAVIKDLRSLKSYNVNGLLPNPIDYSTIFGHDPARNAPGSCRRRRRDSRRSPRSRTAARTSRGPRRRPARPNEAYENARTAPAHCRRGRAPSVRLSAAASRSAHPGTLLPALDVVVVRAQEHQAGHLGQGLAPRHLVGHPDRPERSLDGQDRGEAIARATHMARSRSSSSGTTSETSPSW